MTHPPDDLLPYTTAATAAAAQSRPSDTEFLPPPAYAGGGIEGLDFEISPRVERGALHRSYERDRNEPLYRPLRIFALDPSASRGDGALAVVNVPYEPLKPGPVGRLLSVVDDGLDSEANHALLDLDAPNVLMEQGRTPSATDPRFRAQMTYAVCSITYAAFKHALGRDVTWGFDRVELDGRAPRLVVRSCVEGTRNAFYDPNRGELRFGAFIANEKVEGRNAPLGQVSTALSHDVVVHEMSHALLDGLRSRFMLPTQGDVLAFHEAFADIVALFQRFSYRDVVRAAIVKTNGNLGHSDLTKIGSQFAQTIGLGNALRDAMLSPKDAKLDAVDPHERGKVLLAAVYRAFTTVYERKASRFKRLATNGTGQLPPGQIPDLLADVLTDVACNLASHFLNICIRAIDYCPPVDLTFGEYLRAVITADVDLVPDDPWRYREAWIDAFRDFGIYPSDVASLSEDALLWATPDMDLPGVSALSFAELEFDGDPGHPASAASLRAQAKALGGLVADPKHRWVFGLAGSGDPALGDDTVDLPIVESVRSSRRVGPDGQVVFDLVAEVTQRRNSGGSNGPAFPLYGGATVILDPFGRVRYVIRKSMLKPERVLAIKAYVTGEGKRFWVPASGNELLPHPQPFGMLHEVTRPPTSQKHS